MTDFDKVLEDLNNAVNLLIGVSNEFDNLEHPEADTAHDLYEKLEELYNRLKADPEEPEEGFEEHCHCNRGIRTTPNGTRYCPTHGYEYEAE